MTGPLVDEDFAAALLAVPWWFIEAADPREGTEVVARRIRSLRLGGSWSSCGDGPYSDGENAEWWARGVTPSARGLEVEVIHEVRASGEKTVLRAGHVTWNRLANMVTFAALELRRRRLPSGEGEQTTIFDLAAAPGAR